MNILRTLLVSFLLALFVSHGAEHSPAAAWKVETKILTGPETEVSDHTITATVSNSSIEKSFQIQSPTYMNRVVQRWSGSNSIVVIGQSDWQDEALFIDPGKESVSARAIGYQMHLLNDRYLVSVAFFPTHLSPNAYASDILLVKDLSNPKLSCSQRHSNQEGPGQDLPASFEPLVENAGIPVYPEQSSAQCSYENVGNSPSVTTIDRASLLLLPGNLLTFVSYLGETNSGKEASLVFVPLNSLSPGRPVARKMSLESAYRAAAISDKSRLQIDHLEPEGESSVKIVFTAGAYAHAFAVIPYQP